MKPAIVTLDGPAGVGKSTLARRLAQELGLPFLDTGAMFRFLALKLGDAILTQDAESLGKLASQWQFSLEGFGADTRLLVNGEPIGSEIRTEEISRKASELGKNPAIRKILLDAQQRLGARQALVAEGRDLGTVVFPQAAAKFFLDASPEVRARRRWLELRARGEDADLVDLAQKIRERDEQDRNRAVAPLKAADDAMLVDTSSLSIDEVLAKLLKDLPAWIKSGQD